MCSYPKGLLKVPGGTANDTPGGKVTPAGLISPAGMLTPGGILTPGGGLTPGSRAKGRAAGVAAAGAADI